MPKSVTNPTPKPRRMSALTQDLTRSNGAMILAKSTFKGFHDRTMVIVVPVTTVKRWREVAETTRGRNQHANGLRAGALAIIEQLESIR